VCFKNHARVHHISCDHDFQGEAFPITARFYLFEARATVATHYSETPAEVGGGDVDVHLV